MKNQPLQPVRQEDFWYELPDERIARFPLEERDASNLLVYRQGDIRHSRFRQIAEELKSGDTLFFNNTKVIPARIYFQKETGALAHRGIFVASRSSYVGCGVDDAANRTLHMGLRRRQPETPQR